MSARLPIPRRTKLLGVLSTLVILSLLAILASSMSERAQPNSESKLPEEAQSIDAQAGPKAIELWSLSQVHQAMERHRVPLSTRHTLAKAYSTDFSWMSESEISRAIANEPPATQHLFINATPLRLRAKLLARGTNYYELSDPRLSRSMAATLSSVVEAMLFSENEGFDYGKDLQPQIKSALAKLAAADIDAATLRWANDVTEGSLKVLSDDDWPGFSSIIGNIGDLGPDSLKVIVAVKRAVQAKIKALSAPAAASGKRGVTIAEAIQVNTDLLTVIEMYQTQFLGPSEGETEDAEELRKIEDQIVAAKTLDDAIAIAKAFRNKRIEEYMASRHNFKLPESSIEVRLLMMKKLPIQDAYWIAVWSQDPRLPPVMYPLSDSQVDPEEPIDPDTLELMSFSRKLIAETSLPK